ncbi:MAG TPA: hypothetical protein VMW91_01410 [Desulfosporosinus sp.]|nr:hypothetical protein [Desulfosporosinus sp.]
MIYKIIKSDAGSNLKPAEKTDMCSEHLFEVSDLQSWIKEYPQMLNYPNDSKPIIIGSSVSIGEGNQVDILAVDYDGTIIVCETKRDNNDPLYQALRYTGRLSSMLLEEFTEMVKRKYENGIDSLLEKLNPQREIGLENEYTPSLEQYERKIRIVLFAEDYNSDVFHTAEWLISQGIDIIVIKYSVDRIDADIFFRLDRILPSIDSAKAFQIQQQAKTEEKKARTSNMFRSLIQNSLLNEGEDVFDINGKIIGKVQSDSIIKVDTGVKCVNMFQLIGSSWRGGAQVEREGELTPFSNL